MAKAKPIYTCGSCGGQQPKWQGQCPDCGAWNTLSESAVLPKRSERAQHAGRVELTRLDRVDVSTVDRLTTGLGEFDRVLGGGLVPGGVVLIGGDPGIGKSTLLLKALANLAPRVPTCYVTGEESLEQIGLRAQRLAVGAVPLDMLAETCVEAVLASVAARDKLGVLAIDSIQTLFSEELQSAPGSVSQVRECAAQLTRFAKARNVATLLIGHVTKEGTLAGPRVLEHMVDTVLYFESDVGSRFRIVRAVKNRFGAANEMGFFVMSEEGFREVKNPSAIFLARHGTAVAGSVTLVTREGTRPVLVEVQALVDRMRKANRRAGSRKASIRSGWACLLAVLHRHCSLASGDSDVFANIVGGLRVGETAADLGRRACCRVEPHGASRLARSRGVRGDRPDGRDSPRAVRRGAARRSGEARLQARARAASQRAAAADGNRGRARRSLERRARGRARELARGQAAAFGGGAAPGAKTRTRLMPCSLASRISIG